MKQHGFKIFITVLVLIGFLGAIRWLRKDRQEPDHGAVLGLEPEVTAVRPVLNQIDESALPQATQLADDRDREPRVAGTPELRTYRLAREGTIEYGRDVGSLGIVHAVDVLAGPESFTADSQGNFLICDTVNKRLLRMDATGETLASIELGADSSPADVAVTSQGGVFVYDHHGRLLQFDSNGNRVSEIEVDANRWTASLSMHVIGDRVYMQSIDQEDVLIGVVEDGVLRPPGDDEIRVSPPAGIHGPSGKRYVPDREMLQTGWVSVIDPANNETARLELPGTGIVSVRFIREDPQGNAYIQAERVTDGRLSLEVHIFDSLGEQISVVDLNDQVYHFWTAKLLSVDDAGAIYQFVPGENHASILVYEPQ